MGASTTDTTQGDFGATRLHGQFMPYNDLVEGHYSTATYQTDVLAHEIADTEPRKGERMYIIPRSEADYFFGMELSASFTQTPSGLDAWGHDIIFEFSGDDDFWLYVDGELVLDLGGVHQALTGSVNFRTGVVKNAGTTTSLYEVFKKNYQTRGLSSEEINEKLEEIFTLNEDNQYVFKDFTNHDMKIFYMERGAGASNLHMRFNLAAVRPGTFILSKKLSGTEEADNDLIEFPYQIYYQTQEDGETQWHLLTDKMDDNKTPSVVYQGSSLPVSYEASYTPAGGTEEYEHVFFLKPGQSAEVRLPEKTTNYYVVECGVNPDIYEKVKANGEELTGEDTGNLVSETPRQDFKTPEDTLENRPEVEFENQVDPDAMRTLRVKKILYDVDGQTLLHYPDNDTEFNFRLYLGGEMADPANLPLANLYRYCVIDPAGNYCRWDAGAQKFVSLGVGRYENLNAEQKEQATFTTSMYGAISKIPADYSVEVRNLIISTQYKIEERDYEIPRGYTLRGIDGYTRVDVEPNQTTQDTPYAGAIVRGDSPVIEVRNQKGWGLTVNKVWTDEDFMEKHGDTYLAVYVKTVADPETYTLYEGSVRRLKDPDTEIYFFFEDLNYEEHTYHFSDFAIFEVTLEGDISVDEEGKVTGYTDVHPVIEGGAISIPGTPMGREEQPIEYSVHYEVGQATGHNENVRVDTVTNSRPGIALYKQDLEENNLADAVFTLVDENGQNVAAETYTSGSDGLITIAYLLEGTYTLTEIKAPRGYVVLDHPIVLQVSADGGAAILSADSGLCEIRTDETGQMNAFITIKNRPAGLQAKKIDATTRNPLQGVRFALYRQVTGTDGTVRKDYLPMTGFENLVTDQNGIVPKINMDDLQPGTYYLTETQAAEGYTLLDGDFCFTIGPDGTVTTNGNHANWITRNTEGGSVSYVITILNGEEPEPKEVQVMGAKILMGRDMEHGEFTFTLRQINPDGTDYADGLQMETLCGQGQAGESVPFAFAPMRYTYADYVNAECHDQEGNALFYYVVEENIPADADGGMKDGVVYSTAKFLVVVRLRFENESLNPDMKYYNYDGGLVPPDLRPVESITTETVQA